MTAELRQAEPQPHSVILSLPNLLEVVARWRSQNLTIGFTCGAFDLLHAGHADYLDKARSLCDRLVVGVNSDESIRQYKNPLRPIVGERHRMNVVAALRSVDAVVLMNETRPEQLISSLHPNLYIKGGDYSKEQLKSAPLVESYGGRCAIIPVQHDISSSRIIRRIGEVSQYALPERSSTRAASLVFLDRDGTLIENVHFLNNPERVRLLAGVGEGLRLLQDQGFRLIVVTNQQGIGLGYFDYDQFVATNSALLRQLATYGVRISRFYYCPHSLAENCECRKPGSKLIQRALSDFGAQAECCFSIGDADSDMLAAKDAGCTGILVTKQEPPSWKPTVRSFSEAVHLILESRKAPSL